MIAWENPIETSYPLSDQKDPRYATIMKYRRRFANFLLRSSRVLRQQGEENTVDAIHTLVSNDLRQTFWYSLVY
jgi:proteasome activator subunit 4